MMELPTSPQKLMQTMQEWNIPFTLYEHEAVFTVEEASKLEGTIPGLHTRNLFLRNKKKQNFLITLSDKTAVDLKKLSERLETGRFSFGSGDRLMEFVGVMPGSVTPLAIINDTDLNVQPVWEAAMLDHDLAGYHPLVNTMTVTMNPKHLHDFAQQTGHKPIVLDFTDLG